MNVDNPNHNLFLKSQHQCAPKQADKCSWVSEICDAVVEEWENENFIPFWYFIHHRTQMPVTTSSTPSTLTYESGFEQMNEYNKKCVN